MEQSFKCLSNLVTWFQGNHYLLMLQKSEKNKKSVLANVHKSGQIIATSHDLTSHGRVVGDPALNGLISGKSRLVKYYNLAR